MLDVIHSKLFREQDSKTEITFAGITTAVKGNRHERRFCADGELRLWPEIAVRDDR
jgi:hypothetical protein